MGSIPADRAGSGAAVDGTMGEVGGSLGVAVLGAVVSSRLSAQEPGPVGSASPAAVLEGAGAESGPAVLDAFAAAARTGQALGAAAVMAGGLATAYLLHRARHRKGRAGPAEDGVAVGAVGRP
jgi:hypothetical protein